MLIVFCAMLVSLCANKIFIKYSFIVIIVACLDVTCVLGIMLKETYQ